MERKAQVSNVNKGKAKVRWMKNRTEEDAKAKKTPKPDTGLGGGRGSQNNTQEKNGKAVSSVVRRRRQ